MQQLNALYRAKRWFDFECAFNLAGDAVLGDGTDAEAIRLLGIKVMMCLRKLEKAEELLNMSRDKGESGFEHMLCFASMAGLRAQFDEARRQLMVLNKEYPMNPQVLRRLVQVCDQLRNYDGAAGFLRVALKLTPDDDRLIKRRRQYELLGVW